MIRTRSRMAEATIRVASAVAVAALLCGVPATACAQTPVHWTLAVTSKGPIRPGKRFDAALTAAIDKGWHLYTLEEPAAGPPPTVITLGSPGPFTLAGPVGAPPGERALDSGFNVETEFFEDGVSFTIPLAVAAGTPIGAHVLRVTANWVVCNDRLCLPPAEETTAVEVQIGERAGSEGSKGSEGSRGSEGSGGSPALRGAAPAVVDLGASARASTLGAYVALAALMGALSLATPCVFPMIPITVSYFTGRGRRSRRDAAIQALVYGAGIVLTFTGVGFTLAVAYGASGLNRFAANPWLNLAVMVLFLAFALSLFGVLTIALPSRLATTTTKAAATGRRMTMTGTLLMGLAFTITSFTCTAPFLGTLLVTASQGDWQWPLAGMLAFSTVFALPFVALALVPQALASLPPSGPWLVSLKVVMGFVEVAAAIKFLSNADLVWGWHVFTRPVVIGAWVVLAIVIAAYLAGLIRIGPSPRQRPGLLKAIAAAGAVTLGIWLGSGLAGRRLGELEAFLPPADQAALSPTGELPWILNDYDRALAEARASGGRILIDFTGYTCTNCRWMEANMFPRPDVARELARYVRVRLYTDGNGDLYRSFQRMELTRFGTVALPYYAVLSPDGTPVVGFGGLTRDPSRYIDFLRRGLQY